MTYTVRISNLKAKNSYLKLSLSKSTQRISELESTVAALAEQLAFVERRTEELDCNLSRSEKKAKILEEELSIHHEVSIRDTFEGGNSLGDSEKDYGEYSFREEIELSAKLTLGETEEEQLFSPRSSYIRFRLPEDFEKPNFWSDKELSIESHIGELSVTPVKPQSLWLFPVTLFLWLAVLSVRLLSRPVSIVWRPPRTHSE